MIMNSCGASSVSSRAHTAAQLHEIIMQAPWYLQSLRTPCQTPPAHSQLLHLRSAMRCLADDNHTPRSKQHCQIVMRASAHSGSQPLPSMYQSPAAFTLAPKTKLEQEIDQVTACIRAKPGWRQKCWDAAVSATWRSEALAQGMKPQHFNYAMQVRQSGQVLQQPKDCPEPRLTLGLH